MKFCRHRLGSTIVTPNMHLHGHLKLCIGLQSNAWILVLPLERGNDLLGEIPNTKKSMEVQLMDRFSGENSLVVIPVPTEFEASIFHNVDSQLDHFFKVQQE